MILLNRTDCGSAIKGTGTLGCKVDINYLTQFFLLEDGIEFDTATDTIDQAKIDELVQSGQLVILPEHNSYASESEDTVYETLPSGSKLPVRNGRYEFVAMYSAGICLANSLASLSSKTWNLMMLDFDDSGESRLWGEGTTTGKFKGFGTQLVYAENKVFNDGATSTKTPLRIQLSTKGTVAMRSRVKYLSSDNAVDFANLNGVNDITLAATDTTAAAFKVTAFIDCDGTTPITSNTSVTNWRIINDENVVQSGYTISYTNGAYAISGLVADTYTVEFFDETNEKGIVAVDGKYYDSDVLTVTLT